MVSSILEFSKKFNKREKIFLTAQNLLSMILIIVTIGNCFVSKSKMYDLNEIYYESDNVYSVLDEFHGNAGKTFFERNDCLDVLKNFYNWLNEEFDYSVQGYQGVLMTGKKFPVKFANKYEQGRAVCLDVNKALQVNDCFFERFHLKVDKGRRFEEKDYLLKDNKISVILGSEYNEYINLKDKFYINYLGVNLECEVIGFLHTGSCYNDYMSGQWIKSLDRHIILPIFNQISDAVVFEPDTTRKQFEKDLYLVAKTEGHIKYLGEYAKGIREHLSNMIKQKCEELGIRPEYYLTHNYISPAEQTVWGVEIKQASNLLLMFTVIIIVTSIVCMSTNMTTKILALKEFYAILIANGTQKKDIYISILREIFGLNVLPMAFSACLLGIGGIMSHSWREPIKMLPVIFAIYIIINFISAIYPCIVFKRLNIAKTLQGDN